MWENACACRQFVSKGNIPNKSSTTIGATMHVYKRRVRTYVGRIQCWAPPYTVPPWCLSHHGHLKAYVWQSDLRKYAEVIETRVAWQQDYSWRFQKRILAWLQGYWWRFQKHFALGNLRLPIMSSGLGHIPDTWNHDHTSCARGIRH